MPDLPLVGSNFGYRFEPDCAADQPCHRKLTVVIRSKATEEHFDPDKFECQVVNRIGEQERLEVFHPWPFPNEYQVVAGRAAAIDRHGKKVEAFTFGGTLHVEGRADRTTATIESPAPVLALLAENPFLSRLAARVEALLAQRLAVWESQGKPDQFEARLAGADPRALYRACLHELGKALSKSTVFGGAQDKTLEHLIAAEHGTGEGESLENLV